MTVWIDIDNLPHALIFKPIIRALEAAGHTVHVTARDHAYTCELLDLYGIRYTKIGRHHGKQTWRKVAGTVGRSLSLVAFATKNRLGRGTVGLNHGSRSFVLAARLLGLPIVTMYDYEHVSAGLFNRFSTKVLLPEPIPLDRVPADLRGSDKLVRYPGYKEEIYLGDLQLDPGFAERIGIRPDEIWVTLRSPATVAHYHNPESDAIFDAVLARVAELPNVKAVILPRTKDQARELLERHPANTIILTEPVDGLNLIAHSDLVISGGGTMNREAALLGVPVWSIFRGTPGALDQKLAEAGRLHFVANPAEVAAIPFHKKTTLPPVSGHEGLITFIVDQVTALAAGR